MYIDFEKLRYDLIDYFGSGISIYNIALINIIEVENADENKLIQIAKSNGFSLNDYTLESYTKKLFK